MEWKGGGHTLEIDGKRVCRCVAATTNTKAAERQAVDRALATYGRATALLRKLNGAEQRDADARELAMFALHVGRSLLDRDVPHLELKWFTPDEYPERRGFMRPGAPDVWLGLGLRDEQLAETTLHELKHHSQRDPGGPGAEADADGFARRWARPVWSAFRYSDGEIGRVSVSEARRPFPGPHRHRDVVLSRGRAFYLNLRAAGEPWMRIG